MSVFVSNNFCKSISAVSVIEGTTVGVGVFSCKHLKNPHQYSIKNIATCASCMFPRGKTHPTSITIVPFNKVSGEFIWRRCFPQTQQYTTSMGWPIENGFFVKKELVFYLSYFFSPRYTTYSYFSTYSFFTAVVLLAITLF